jgi:segregation and condensation protein B
MNLDNAVEAILFVSPKSLTIGRIAKLAKCSMADVRQSLENLSIRYSGRGIILKRTGNKAQLLSHPDFEEVVKPIRTHVAKKRMTKAAIETLAIITSKGEATKSEVTKYRGFVSDNTIDGLVAKGLLERKTRPTAGKRIHVSYKVTDTFRRMAGLTDVKELKTRFASLVDEPLELFSGD